MIEMVIYFVAGGLVMLFGLILLGLMLVSARSAVGAIKQRIGKSEKLVDSSPTGR